jgi:hypothetical protein
MAKTPKATGMVPNDKEDRNARALREQHIGSYVRVMAAKKAADKAVRDLTKTVKAEGGEFAWDMLKLQVKIREGGKEATEQARKEIKAIAQALRWENLPIGHEDDMFDEDRADAEELAYRAGERAGMAGESLRVPDEYGASTATGQAYSKGWHAGQEALFDIQKPKDEEKPTDAKPAKVGTVKTPESVH